MILTNDIKRETALPSRIYKVKGVLFMWEINQKIWGDYMRYKKGVYTALIPDNVESSLVSERNWAERRLLESSEQLGIHVKPGDICFTDFGIAYLNESGFQHFGLLISIFQKKGLMVPMSSNPVTYAKAYDPLNNPEGRRHLMRIGQVKGLNKPSVLFLNDIKFVNTARIIDIKAHIDVNSEMFRTIKARVLSVVSG